MSRNERHGMAYTRLHAEWRRMKERCGLTKCKNPSAIKYYINKGITVCRAWRRFSAFAEWALSHGYSDSLTLDRRRSSEGYKPSNCRWISMADNLRNRPTVKLNFKKAAAIKKRYEAGETQAAIALSFGVTQGNISKVLSGKRWSA